MRSNLWLILLIAIKTGFLQQALEVLCLKSGEKVFVKIGSNEQEKLWANKEAGIYCWLENESYAYAPRLIAHSEGAFAIDDMADLEFPCVWNNQKINAVLSASDSLVGLTNEAKKRPDLFEGGMRISNLPNGWKKILDDYSSVSSKLQENYGFHLDISIVKKYLAQTDNFLAAGNKLIHGDIRGDNLAYDKKNNRAYLIDWNWAEIGNQDLDIAGFLISVQKQGYKVIREFEERLNYEAVLFSAGFWIWGCSNPPYADTEKAASLRDSQMESAKVALDIANKLNN